MALPKYLKIFDIRIQELRDGAKKPKVVFNKGIEVFFNGEKVDLGQYSGGFLNRKDDIVANLTQLAENGKLKEDFVEQQITYMEEKNISSVFEISTVKKA
jgi:hypothetical protein